jgi:hypothetical protein
MGQFRQCWYGSQTDRGAPDEIVELLAAGNEVAEAGIAHLTARLARKDRGGFSERAWCSRNTSTDSSLAVSLV